MRSERKHPAARNQWSAGGSVHLYRLDQGRWTFEQEVAGSDREAFDDFGASISLDGDNLAIGTPGHSYGGSSVSVRVTSSSDWAPPGRNSGNARLQGCWEILASPFGAPDIHGLIAFHRDGTATGETVIPTVSGADGSWDPAGHQSYAIELTHLRTASDGSFEGRTRVHGALRVDRDSDEASGDFVAELFDAQDHLLQTVDGTVVASRNSPAP